MWAFLKSPAEARRGHPRRVGARTHLFRIDSRTVCLSRISCFKLALGFPSAIRSALGEVGAEAPTLRTDFGGATFAGVGGDPLAEPGARWVGVGGREFAAFCGEG